MDENKKIKTGLDKIDEILSSGLTKSEMSIFIAEPNRGKTKFVFDLETVSPFYSREMADKVTETGQCLISDMIKRLEQNGVDTSAFKMSKTRYEKFGNTIYPVTYGPNGIVIVDYPQVDYLKLYKKKNDNSTGSTLK